jgi:hypothetical protein
MVAPLSNTSLYSDFQFVSPSRQKAKQTAQKESKTIDKQREQVRNHIYNVPCLLVPSEYQPGAALSHIGSTKITDEVLKGRTVSLKF